MSLYVDSSALVKLYLDERDSEAAEQLLAADEAWISARHAHVEVRRTLARTLSGAALRDAREQFDRDWRGVDIVELTADVCAAATDIAETTGARTLDALHLGAARAVGGGVLPIVTFDLRQAQSARALGWTVLGS